MSARADILAAGYQVLRREGAVGLSLRAVAKEVGVTPMALYRHFESKDDLFNALMRDGLGAWEARLLALSGGAPLARISEAFDAFLDFALIEPERFEAAFMLAAPGARKYPDDFLADRSPGVALLITEIKRAMRDKAMTGPSALEIAMTLWAMAQGLISLYRAGRFTDDERAFRALYRRAMKRCLASFQSGAAS
jgi:AcrR family transcriptional regulator